MAICTPIPMEEWRQAPKVSLRTMIELCNCQIPLTQTSFQRKVRPQKCGQITVPVVCHILMFCLGEGGSLTRSFMQLRYCCYSFSRHAATSCTAEGVWVPGPFWGVCTNHACALVCVLCPLLVMKLTAYLKGRLIVSLVYSPCS